MLLHLCSSHEVQWHAVPTIQDNTTSKFSMMSREGSVGPNAFFLGVSLPTWHSVRVRATGGTSIIYPPDSALASGNAFCSF